MQVNNQESNQRETSKPSVIDIELLALDLNSCTRCVGTLNHIEEAIDTIRPILEVMKMEMNVRKIVVESEEQASRLRFSTSPTVRINGHDITFETLESECDTCTDLCGCNEGTNCRVWSYQGKEYTEAPVGLLVESILRETLANSHEPAGVLPEYKVPENLRRFFKGKPNTQVAGEKTCCSESKQEVCCEPTEKPDCCDISESEACGCQ